MTKTMQSIVDDVTNLPSGGLTNTIRRIVALEAAVAAEMVPVENERTSQWGAFFESVVSVLEPVYAKRSELGADFTVLVLDAYDTALTTSIRLLLADGVAVKLSKNGAISEPKRLAQYDTNVRRVLKFDTEGVLLSRDDDGELKHSGKSAVEKLGKKLSDEAETKARTEAIDRAKASGKYAELFGTKPEATDATSENKGEAGNDEAKGAVVHLDGLTPDQQATMALIVEMSVLLNQQQRTDKGVTLRGEERVNQQLDKIHTALGNLLSHTFFVNVNDSLKKAANS